MTEICGEDISASTDLEDVTVSMKKLHIDHTGIELIHRRPTVEEAFGEDCRLCPQSRDTQISQILRRINEMSVRLRKKKCGSLYFHASPGVGKTFLLSRLYSLKVPDTHFFVADFNRNCCDDAAAHKDTFLHDPEFFILLRLYYVECVDQSKRTWIAFINKVIENLRTVDGKESYKNDIRKALRDRVVQSSCRISVILVDEIQKTERICRGSDGINFSNQCRSYLCRLVDDYRDICSLVIFSSVDVSFMMDETTASGRPMNSVCRLPLLTFEQTRNILQAEVQCLFVDEEHITVSRDQYLEQLADVCGGHARSIEYVVSVCNNIIDAADRKSISDIIEIASYQLTGAYRHVKNHDTLLKAILLGKEVSASDLVGDETYESLVNRGVLLNSLDDAGSSKFVPMCPELFLHAWTQPGSGSNISVTMRRLLRQILELRGKFTRKRFENLHCIWEQLIRLARPVEEYRRVSLRTLYCVTNSDYNCADRASENATLCPVDAAAELTLLSYNKGDIVNAQLNSILSPSDDYNVGWDRLIFYEAFPCKAKRKRFTLPVFIQNMYSTEDATTKLTLAKVKSAVKHCQNFLSSQCIFTNCQLIPKKTGWFNFGSNEFQFVLLFIVKQKSHGNTTSDAPSNVIFCFEEDLKILYGKTLSGFVKFLVPDSTIYAATEIEHSDETQG